MTTKIIHLLTGYAKFEIHGDSARFINMAARSGLALWGFSTENGVHTCCCRAADYKKLRQYARRSSAKLHCTEKHGAPFYTAKLLKRKGLLIGGACGIALYIFLGSFVWGVTVTGVDTLTDKAILTSAKSNGIYIGASRQSFSPRVAARGIVADLPELKWASVNTNGCFVEISVSESAKKPEITDDTKWSNITAGRAGTIVAIEAEHGRPEVKIGDTVAEGDLLISGLYQEEIDPYSPPPDDPYQSLGSARGRVLAETYREFTVQVATETTTAQPTGQRQKNSSVNIFGVRLPLGINTVPQGEFTSYTKVKNLCVLGTQLPISLETTVYAFTEEAPRTLTKSEAEQTALLKLREAQKATLPTGGTVHSEELSYTHTNGVCILTAKCRCIEEIGVLREVLLNPTETP